jgi:photosystem II stability/assembly factor-like uncharacterized protein
MKTSKSSLSLLYTGIILLTLLIHPNLKTQWFPVNSAGTNYNLRSIQFINDNTGYATGYYVWGNFPNDVIKTTNGGDDWNVIYSESMALFNQIFFANEYTGYLVGGLYASEHYKLRKTTNSGINWFSIDPINIYGGLSSCSFTDVNTGYATISGAVIKTINGGYNWQLLYNDTSTRYTYITFVNPDVGYSVGLLGKIIKTLNAGLNWVQLISGTSNNLSSIFFVNINTGYAVGSFGTVIKTTNSGLSWININNLFIHLNNVWFTSALTGYVIGISGSILKTIDGGLSFSPQLSFTGQNLNSVYFINDNTGFVCGDTGTIRKTTNGGVIGINDPSSNIPDKYYLHQNYPNPFNPKTIIEFDIPKNSFVILKVYNSIGVEVKTLFNGYITAGAHKLDFDAISLPSGVYFYQMTAGDYIQTRKMILIK